MTEYSTTGEICFPLEDYDDGFLNENGTKIIDELTPYFKLYTPDYWFAELKIDFDVDVSHSPAYWSDVTGGSPEEYDDERTVTHAELLFTANAPDGTKIEHVHRWAYSKNATDYENYIVYALQDAFAKTIQEAEVHFPEPDDKYDTDPRV